MSASDPKNWNFRRFDARAFAEAGATLNESMEVSQFERLLAEQHPDSVGAPSVEWTVEGEKRSGVAGAPSVWMHLRASLALPVGCQRCLAAVAVPLEVDRWFRFVADEATAEAEDDVSEEDVLALEPRPDLIALIEDELLMALPLVPMHGACPLPPSGTTVQEALEPPEPQRPHPFAALAKLRK